MKNIITARDIISHDPCDDYPPELVRQLIGDGKTPLEILDLPIPAEDRIWVMTRPGMVPEHIQDEFARKCALSVIHLWNAPNVVKRFLETGDKSLLEASVDASWAAVRTVDAEQIADAAWAALWAADAARIADASWAAARAATAAAARAAAAAAERAAAATATAERAAAAERAAERAAAATAARAAAATAERAAERAAAAARAAEREEQIQFFKKLLF